MGTWFWKAGSKPGVVSCWSLPCWAGFSVRSVVATPGSVRSLSSVTEDSCALCSTELSCVSVWSTVASSFVSTVALCSRWIVGMTESSTLGSSSASPCVCPGKAIALIYSKKGEIIFVVHKSIEKFSPLVGSGSTWTNLRLPRFLSAKTKQKLVSC